MSAPLIGIIVTILFLVLLFLKMPIALAMALSGVIGYTYIVNLKAALRILSSDIFTTFNSYSLSVIPMFILMGFIAYHAGVGERLYSFAYKIIGRLPGGLAITSVFACAIFGAICGSSSATAATIGAIAIPEMKKYGYSDSLSAGSVASGGALGVIIPPSIIFVIYGIATEQSIARLFLAGILPGILLLISYTIAILIITSYNPSLAPVAVEQRPNLQEIIASFGKGLLPVLIIFVLSMGGLFAGWFTPTEAGGIGAAGILAIAFVEKTMNWRKFNAALMDTTRTVAMILLIVAGATIFTRTIVRSEIPFKIASWAGDLPLPHFIIVIIILLICVFLGTFIEAIPLILIATPVFFPVVVEQFGYDPIWFGVIIVMIVVMGVITPPVGINVYVTKGIATDIPLVTIFKGIWPFLIAAIICSVIIIIFPQISLFLPNLLR